MSQIFKSTFATLREQGELLEAFLFEDAEPSLIYISESLTHQFPLALNIVDAATAMHKHNLRSCEIKINTLKQNFQSLPWFKRWYYGLLSYTFWLPIFPKVHREQCRNTESRLSELTALEATPYDSFYKQCQDAYLPVSPHNEVRHYALLPLSQPVFFLDSSGFFETGKMHYWQDTVMGWMCQKPLFNHDVDWIFTFYTQSGRTLTSQADGRFRFDGGLSMFLSEKDMKQAIENKLKAPEYVKMSTINTALDN